MAMRFQSIMVAADGSDGSKRAIDVASALARAEGARLSIVTVVTSTPGPAGRDFERIARVEPDPAEASGQSILTEAQQRVGADVKSKPMLVRGDPAEAIISAAVQEKVDAIVVGRRGQGRLAALLLGSVSQKLVCLSPCMVVVVP